MCAHFGARPRSHSASRAAARTLRISSRTLRCSAVAKPRRAPPLMEQPKLYDSLLLQGFGWDSCRAGDWWQKIEGMADEIARAGFTHVWLPPPSQSVSQEGYLPSQLYNMNSAYGTAYELRSCVRALKRAGVSPVVDLVFNHRCADTQNEDGQWTIFSDAHEPFGVASCSWDESAITSDDPTFGGTGSMDTGEDFHAAPDLDHTNRDVQGGLSDFARYMVRDVGFEGLRFDFSKGYGGKYAGLYTEAALPRGGLAVGEFWVPLKYDDKGQMLYDQEDNRRRVGAWIAETGGRCLAFDFSTKGILQDAIRFKKYHWLADPDNKPHGLIGTQPTHSVTFIDNHDTGSSQRHWPFPRMKKLEGYAYILTHPGIPTIFWEHLYEDSEALREGIMQLIQVRRQNRIQADSPVSILKAAPTLYVADVEGDDGVVRVKLGPEKDLGEYEPKRVDGWVKVAKGSDFCVWERL